MRALRARRRRGPGASAIVTRLSEILFVQTLRSHVAAHPEEAIGWAGFVDPHLGPALARIHEAPGTDWSLAALARAAGLSRTRFRNLMGQTPFEYIARWRMTCAKTELRRLSRSIADTARDLGYRSEAAFNRAFTKRATASAPARSAARCGRARPRLRPPAMPARAATLPGPPARGRRARPPRHARTIDSRGPRGPRDPRGMTPSRDCTYIEARSQRDRQQDTRVRGVRSVHAPGAA